MTTPARTNRPPTPSDIGPALPAGPRTGPVMDPGRRLDTDNTGVAS